MESIIEIKNLYFSYDNKDVLNGLNLAVKKGELLAIVGENGAGKSTLLNIILGYLSPKSGKIRVLDTDDKKKYNKKISYISQNTFSKYRDFPTTVYEVVKINSRYLKKRINIDELLSKMKLNNHKNHSLRELSGGQIQRLTLLLALLKGSDIIILDEATSGVDKKFADEIYSEFKSLSDEGITFIVVTHHLNEIINYITAVAKIEDGKMTKLTRDEAVEEIKINGHI